jgi:predicted phage baseplate assembly protein
MEVCSDEMRRQKVIESGSGIDYVEIIHEKGKNHPALCLHFFGEMPKGLKAQNFRIEGGRRIRDIKILSIKYPLKTSSRGKKHGPEKGRCLLINVDKQGDFSNYVLKAVEADDPGKPLHLLDPRYAQVEFSFKANCPIDLDCKSLKVCAKPSLNEPDMVYLAKDYSSFRQLILDRLALIMPEWKEQHIPDLEMALVEAMAYEADHLSYYQDAVATEAYLNTARQRISIKRHVRLIDYRMHEGCNARALVHLETDADLSLYQKDFYFITSKTDDHSLNGVLSHEDLLSKSADSYEVFEPMLSRGEEFTKEDLKDVKGLISNLGKGFLLPNLKNPIFRYLAIRMSGSFQGLLVSCILKEFVNGLNNLIKSSEIYNDNAFSAVNLSKKAKALLRDRPKGDDLIRLNRMLLDEAFPDYFISGDAVQFGLDNINDYYPQLIADLRSGILQESNENPIYSYLGLRLAKFAPGLLGDHLIELFANSLNSLLGVKDLFDENALRSLEIRDETLSAYEVVQKLLSESEPDENSEFNLTIEESNAIFCFNRMVLEDAYPDHFGRTEFAFNDAESIRLNPDDIRDPFDLLNRLGASIIQEDSDDEISKYIAGHFSEKDRSLLKNMYPVSPSSNSSNSSLQADIFEPLIKELNTLLKSGWLHNEQAFIEAELRDDTKRLLIEKPHGQDLIALNKLLLEDALSKYLRRGDEIRLFRSHNCIKFYTWGDRQCCIPKGSVSATLLSGNSADERLQLQPGDILIFEEVKGPKTGEESDADVGHRHAVRLTKVEPEEDSLFHIPVLEVEWNHEDALPFPLCISAIGSEPFCKLIEDISVARGNIVLVDHGRTIRDDSPATESDIEAAVQSENRIVEGMVLGTVPEGETESKCEGEGRLSDILIVPGEFRPRLQDRSLTFSQPLETDMPACKILIQDPRQAVPQIKLTGVHHSSGLQVLNRWESRIDLLESKSLDRHFAIEVDDDGWAYIFFGDGELGRLPEAGTVFWSTYRVGNGLVGNVGSEKICWIVFSSRRSGLSLRPRNPLPASGGADPEPVAEAKLFAPQAYRSKTKLQRAVVPQDYADLAQMDSRVQRSMARRRWTGSWYEILVALDPLGQTEASQELIDDIEQRLLPYRRMGQNMKVAGASYVPLELSMTVCVKPEYLKGHVEAALMEAFSNRYLEDGGKGFFHPDELSFGDGVYLSKIVTRAQAVPGVETVKVTALKRLNQPQGKEIENGVLPLDSYEIALLDNDVNFPENGVLKLEMVGGR